LLLLDATIQSQDAVATLNALLGEQGAPHYLFVNEGTAAAPPPDDPEALVGVAFAHRPDLQSAAEQAEAAKKFSSAEHDLNRPTLSALGTAGGSPIRSDHILLVWRSGRKPKHSHLQRLPLLGKSAGGRPESASDAAAG
jgi:outer membrane protein